MVTTAHTDTFVRDHLPPPDQLPRFKLDLPGLDYPARLNCAAELLDAQVATGCAKRLAVRSPQQQWTYAALLAKANQVARVLVEDLGLKPGNRVLIRSANNPMFVACWLGVAKAGGVVVPTMPLLRAAEIAQILDKAQVQFALCDERLADELEKAGAKTDTCAHTCMFNGSGQPGAGAELERLMSGKPTDFNPVDTASDDPVLIAFTSGTTGKPKAAVHVHRDVLAMCDTYAKHILQPTPQDVFIGSPPIAFTFGLGGLVAFPLRVGASTVLLEAAGPPALLEAIGRFKATVCVTSPTAYRMMADALGGVGLGESAGADSPGQEVAKNPLASLRKCVSAGETLPKATFELWRERTGLKIMDGIGSTEMLHIFIAARQDEIRPGATGKPVPGYEAMVADEAGNPLPPGEVGRLAVRGPTGCRYLDDARQADYVQGGWNYTGDAYRMDADGYYWFQARTDDMIVSAGYNISGPEVEGALLGHEAVAECAVVAAADEVRSQIVKAFVVVRQGYEPGEALVKELQTFVKNQIAPYKYPRAVAFVASLPKTETGKVQRFKLRQRAQEQAR